MKIKIQLYKKKHFIPTATAIAILCVSAFFWWKYTIDDTYITLRYSHNLAMGNGPVFNVGEKVEGYSCPMWVFFLGFAEWIGCDPVFTSKAIGFLCALGLVILLNTVLRHSIKDPFIAGFVTLWFTVLPGLHVYFCSGMETIPFAFAIAFISSIPCLITSKTIKAFLMPIGLLVVATLRPEGLLLCTFLSILWFITEKSSCIRVSLILLYIILLCLFLLRYDYYGSFLPNTYLAKPSPIPQLFQGLSIIHGIVLQIDRILSYETIRPVLDRLGGIGLLFCIIFSFHSRIHKPFLLTLVASVFTGMVFLFYAPYDWMPADRFVFPFIFPLLILAGMGFHHVWVKIPEISLHKLRIVFLLLLLFWSFANIRDNSFMLRSLEHGWINTALDGKKYEEIGNYLKKNSLPTDRVLTYEIGAVGYFSQLTVIDHEGLIDKYIAQVIKEAYGYVLVRWGLDEEAMEKVVQYCVSQEPEWFLVRTNTRIVLNLGQPITAEIANETIQQALLREFGDRMILTKIFIMGPDSDPDSDLYLLLHRISDKQES